MITLYQCTIFANLALLAVVIAIFVFAASIYRAVLELSAKEEENAFNRRKELISTRRKEVIGKMEDVDESAFPKELRAELDKFDAELKNIDQSITKSRNKAKALTARNMVFTPASFLLMSIITSGIAIATSGILPTIMWIVSLASMITGSYFIYRNLSSVEFFSKFIDLGMLMEQALDRHRMKSTPIVEIELLDFLLTIKGGETKEIDVFASLKQGFIAKNTQVRFSGTEELDFPDQKIEQREYDYNNMRKPKQFWQKIGNINPKVHKHGKFKVKAPDQPGEYTMAYWVQCDEWASEEKTFTIKVT